MGYELEFGPGWTTLVDYIEALCYIKDNQSSIASPRVEDEEYFNLINQTEG